MDGLPALGHDRAMAESLSQVIYAALVFVGLHVLASTPLRAAAVKALGERVYLAVFSVLAILSLVWLVRAYGRAPHVELWAPPLWAYYLPWVVMPVAFVLVVLGYLTPNPTMVMSEKRLEASDPAPGVLKITRHPLMWGVALWALSHIPANGDAASLVLFGAFAALSLGGMRLLDRRKEEKLGARWGPFALTTSAIPFVAALQGRTRIVWGEIGWGKVALGLALYAVFAALHEPIIGVAPFPG